MTAKCLGLDMVVHNIDLSKGEHKHPMYLKHINPKGQVPAIVDSDGTTVGSIKWLRPRNKSQHNSWD